MRAWLAALLTSALGCGAPQLKLKPTAPSLPSPHWVRAAAVEVGQLRAPQLSWAAAQTLVLAQPDQVVVVDTRHKLVIRQQELDHLPDGSPTWSLDARGRWLLLYGTQALTLWDVLSWSPLASVPCLATRCERGALLSERSPVVELQWPSQQTQAREWAALDPQTGALQWRVGRAPVYVSELGAQGQLFVAQEDEVVSLDATASERTLWRARARRLFISEDELAWLEDPTSLRVCALGGTHQCVSLNTSAPILDVRWAKGSLWVAMTTGLARWHASPARWSLAQEQQLDWAADANWRDAQLKDGALFVNDQRGTLRVCALGESTLELGSIPLSPHAGFAVEALTRVWLIEGTSLVLYQRQL